jgi:hypothetical protein
MPVVRLLRRFSDPLRHVWQRVAPGGYRPERRYMRGPAR